VSKVLIQAVGDDAIVRVQGPITLGTHSEPEPDFSILHLRDDYYTAGDNTHPTPADIHLVIEVSVSSVNYDRNVKVPLYAEFKIPAVLLIIPEERSMIYYSDPVDGEYRQIAQLIDFSAIPLGTLERVRIDLSRLQTGTPGN
jgi:hypothetical protein